MAIRCFQLLLTGALVFVSPFGFADPQPETPFTSEIVKCEHYLKDSEHRQRVLRKLYETHFDRPFTLARLFPVSERALALFGLINHQSGKLRDNLMSGIFELNDPNTPVELRLQMFVHGELAEVHVERLYDLTPTRWQAIARPAGTPDYQTLVARHPLNTDRPLEAGYHTDPDGTGARLFVTLLAKRLEIGVDAPCDRVDEFITPAFNDKVIPIVTKYTTYCRVPVARFTRP